MVETAAESYYQSCPLWALRIRSSWRVKVTSLQIVPNIDSHAVDFESNQLSEKCFQRHDNWLVKIEAISFHKINVECNLKSMWRLNLPLKIC